jgi:hypothetical protein
MRHNPMPEGCAGIGIDALRGPRRCCAGPRLCCRSEPIRGAWPPHGRACVSACPARNAIVVGDAAADGDSCGRDWIDHLGSRPRSPASPSACVIVSRAPAGTVADHWAVTLEEHPRVHDLDAAGDARRLCGSPRRRCGAVRPAGPGAGNFPTPPPEASGGPPGGSSGIWAQVNSTADQTSAPCQWHIHPQHRMQSR